MATPSGAAEALKLDLKLDRLALDRLALDRVALDRGALERGPFTAALTPRYKSKRSVKENGGGAVDAGGRRRGVHDVAAARAAGHAAAIDAMFDAASPTARVPSSPVARRALSPIRRQME